MHRLDGELPMGERARLIEDHSIHLRQDVHEVGTLHEDTLAGSASDATEEGQGHTDDEGTGTGDHEEHQGTINPLNIEH